MTSTLLESRPSPLPNRESAIADESSEILARHVKKGDSLKLCIVDSEQEEVIVLPAPVAALLLGILRMMANGLGIALTPLHSELTTRQAADILNVSRPYLVKLLESGEIPFHKVGRHRRIRREDVMNYKQNLRREREAILDKMVAEVARDGLV